MLDDDIVAVSPILRQAAKQRQAGIVARITERVLSS